MGSRSGRADSAAGIDGYSAAAATRSPSLRPCTVPTFHRCPAILYRTGTGHRAAATTGRNVSFQICNLDLAGRQLERATTIMIVKYIFKSGF